MTSSVTLCTSGDKGRHKRRQTVFHKNNISMFNPPTQHTILARSHLCFFRKVKNSKLNKLKQTYKGVITWRISARVEFSAAPFPPRLKFCCDYMASFSPGLSTFFHCRHFVSLIYSVNAPAQTHVSTRAEILLRLHEVFQPSSPG